MPGRKKEPVDLIVLKGKKHLTKAEIEERKEEEIKVVPDELVIPYGLTEEQERLFVQTYNDLAEYDMATHLEMDILTRFVKAKSEYDRLSALIEQMEVDDFYLKVLTLRLRVSEELRKCECDLGLNVFARMKMVAPKKDKPEPTQAERLFGEL
jgi:hypothetical protein